MSRVLKVCCLVLLPVLITAPAAAGFVELTLPALGAEPGQIDGGSFAAWPDADGDGYPDLHLGGDVLYINNWDGTFTLATGLGLDTEWGHDYRVSWADADNDGDQDCVQSCDLVTTAGRVTAVYYYDNGGPPGFSFSRSTIYQNPTNLRSETPVFFEADGDGACEIYQTIFGNWEPNYTRGPDRLFEAASPGAWADVTELRIPQLGNTNFERQSRGVAVCDYDSDLDLDIFVPVYGVSPSDPSWENLLWRNDGAGYFVDAAEEAGVHIEPHGRYGIGLASGASWGDYDNDGDFDLVVANIHGRAAIFRNQGDGTFFNTSDDNGLPLMQNEWHSAIWLDHDNDGDLDLIACQWYEHYGHLFENLGPEQIGQFQDVTQAMGLDQQKFFRQISCLAVADYDRDGDVDLYFNGGLDDLAGKHLLGNDLDPDGTGDHWLVLILQGDPQHCGIDAVGASARLVFEDGTLSGARQVESATGDGTMNMRPLHFGMGARNDAVGALVTWPYGGVERFHFVGPGDCYRGLRQGTGEAVSGLLAVTGPGPAQVNPPAVRPWSSLASGGPLTRWEAYGVTGTGSTWPAATWTATGGTKCSPVPVRETCWAPTCGLSAPGESRLPA